MYIPNSATIGSDILTTEEYSVQNYTKPIILAKWILLLPATIAKSGHFSAFIKSNSPLP